MVSMRPPQPQAITKVSISALVISLPIIYVSLLRLPPSTLARDTTFWFLMSNSIIAIIAADSSMHFFSSASPDSGHDDDDLCSIPGYRPAVAVQEVSYDAASVMASDEPTAVNFFGVVRGEELRKDGVASFMVTSTDMEGHALALIKGEDAARKPSTDMDHALVPQRCEEEEATDKPISTNKNYAMIVKGEGEEEEEEEEEEVASSPKKLPVEEQLLIRPHPACESGDDVVDELTIIDYDYALSETEPWRPRLVTSKSQRPISHPRIMTPDDVPQDSSTVVASEGKLRCSATEGSRPPEYWRLSDEELNWKVEEFITRFNRDSMEQEAAV